MNKINNTVNESSTPQSSQTNSNSRPQGLRDGSGRSNGGRGIIRKINGSCPRTSNNSDF